MEFILSLMALGILAFSIVITVLAVGAWIRANRAEQSLDRLNAALQRLTQRLYALEQEVRRASASAPEPAHPSAPQPETPPVARVTPARPPVVLEEPPQRVEPAAPIVPPPATPKTRPAPPLIPPPVQPVRPAPESPPRRFTLDWESLVGVKLFSWIAGIALALAAVFFLRYSIERGWLMPPVRMAIGLLVGAGLIVLCELKAARKYPVTANSMDAAGIAILFATFFAAHTRWELIGTPAAFIFLALVTALAVWLSIRRDSAFMALLGLLGGFATPALLSTGENRPIPLFGYLVILNAGLSWVSYRKNWRLLTLLSLVFTALYQWGWVMKFLTAGDLPLAAGIFLIFPILGFAVLSLGRKTGQDVAAGTLSFAQTANLGALLPIVFALYLPTVPAFGERIGILFGFLLCLDAGLLAVALASGEGALHFAGGLSTVLVFAIWLQASYRSAAWPTILAFIAVFAILYLAAPIIAQRFGKRLSDAGGKAVFAAPVLLSCFAVLAGIERRCAAPGLLFTVLFILAAAAAAVSVIIGKPAVHFLAAVFVVAAELVWTFLYLADRTIVPGLALYVVFGIFYIAVPCFAHLWRGDKRVPAGVSWSASGSIYLGLAGHAFLLWAALLSSETWPIFVAIAVLDLAAGISALLLRRSALHAATIVASFMVLIVWLASDGSASPWPVVTTFAAAALVIFGCVWMYVAQRAGIRNTGFPGAAIASLFLSQGVLLVVARQSGAPGTAFIAAGHVIVLVVLLVLSWRLRWHVLAIASVPTSALATLDWRMIHTESIFWKDELSLALPVYLVFLAFPLVLGRRAGRLLPPYLAAVLASAVFFFLGRDAMIRGGLNDVIGVLPVAQAALSGVLLVLLLRIEQPGERALGRLALVAGTVLAFVTAAIPLQLEKEWITIGWALEGAALAWLWGKIPHRGLLYACTTLLAVVFVRLALNSQVLTYYPRGMPILNWYLYTYLVSAGNLLVAAWLLVRRDDVLLEGLPRASSLLRAGGTILLFLLVNIEIADFFSTGSAIVFNFTATLAQDLTYTLAWGLFALIVLGVGLAMQSRSARIAAITLLVATIVKCFLHDLARLGGLYRVASFVGLALCLALVAIVLQKFLPAAARPRGNP